MSRILTVSPSNCFARIFDTLCQKRRTRARFEGNYKARQLEAFGESTEALVPPKSHHYEDFEDGNSSCFLDGDLWICAKRDE